MIAAAILVMVAAAVSWVGYRSERLWLPMGLRFASLLLLAWLLTDPVWRWMRTHIDKPVWVVLVDESRSLEAFSETRNTALTTLTAIDTSGRSVRIRPFGGETTDLDAAFAGALAADDPDGIVLVSDGILTSGRDPVSRIEAAGVPVHVVPIGDPSPRRDIAVLDAGFPERAPSESPIDVPVRLIANGFTGQPLTVRLLADGTEIATQEWVPATDSDYHAPVFRIRTGAPGRTRYEVRIDPMEGESTDRNNRHIAILQVVADRIRVAHIIQETHPDVGTFHRILAEEASIELTSHRFREPVLDSADVLVIHGWPNDPDGRARLNEAIRRLPHVIAPLPVTWTHPDLRMYYGASSVAERLPMNERLGAHPITDLPALDTDRSPFLFGPSAARGDASVILRGTDGQPMTRIRNESPRAVILDAWGWHRWHRSPSRAESEWTARFIQQMVLWAATTDEDSGIQLDGLDDVLSDDAPVAFFARVRNSAGQPQSDADVTVRVSDRVYRMEPRGDGLYEIAFPPLPAGEHLLRVEAAIAGQPLAQTERRIESGAAPLEFRNLRRNDLLLKALADRSGGEVGTLESVVRQIETAAPTVRDEVEVLQVRRHPAWFILLIGLLSAEWIIRRRLLKP